ncbi:MAG: SusC/RagA family TonB-linked outer membrane protein [Tannerellaceae bacterium]|nr:SusC/RagA family TonB-linked outer membrane protein [Tannerellaceae bacterium]
MKLYKESQIYAINNFSRCLFLFFLLFGPLNVYAQNQSVTLTNGITIRDAFIQIEEQTGLSVDYNDQLINADQPLTTSYHNVRLTDVLTSVLNHIDCSYVIQGNHILIVPKASSQDNQRIITGIVYDEWGEPIIGANIMEKGTVNGTITNIDGAFSIAVSENAVLEISYVGYITRELTVTGQQEIRVDLSENRLVLDDVVVVGYGTMRKKDLTGAVTTIKTDRLAMDQPETVQDMLRVAGAGLYVGLSNDTKGNSGLLVRGEKSVKGGNSPLVVLDGVIYPGEITDINPNDIEQMDILKDASSAAVYGAKSANGVLLITTKKGGGKKPLINFNTTLGISMTNSIPAVYKGEDYLRYRQAAMESTYNTAHPGHYASPNQLPSGVSLDQWMAYTNATGDPEQEWLRRLSLSAVETENYLAGKVVDWEDVLYNSTALRQDYTVSISGKKDEVSYYSSVNYLKNENNLKGGGYDAVRARINLESKAFDRIVYGINAQMTSRNEGYVPVSQDYYDRHSPYASVYDEDGKPRLLPHDDNNDVSPIINAYYTDKKYTINNLNVSAYLKVDLPFGFSVQTTYSPRYEWVKELVHQSSKHPEWELKGGMAKRRHKENLYWQWDNMLKWNKEFGKNSFDVTLLANWEKNQIWESTMENDTFQPSDVLGYGYINAGQNPVINSSDEYSTGDAYMGRLHYTFDRKYIATLTVRRDGYSAFGQRNPRATFPSAAIGWVFSEENFFPQNPWLEYGKLRLSWGKNGNRDVGVYEALMDMAARKYLYASVQTGETYPVNAYFANRMANADLKWETTTALNGGLDFSLLQGRLAGSIDVYKMNTTDLLNKRKLPNVVGYSTVTSNIGEIQNTGLEISLNSMNIENTNFKWNTSFNFSYNKNQIKHIYGDMVDITDAEGNVIGQREADDPANNLFIGKPKNVIWGYKVIGVWQEDEAEEAAKYGLRPGDFRILDVDGNYEFTDEDKVFQGESTPKLRLNMRNEFTIFKNITISLSMYAYLGYKGTFNQAKHTDGVLLRMSGWDLPYWTPENPTNKYARLNSSGAGLSYNVYRNKSFVRLDNISVSYSFPKRMIDPFNVTALRGTVSMKNVAFWAPDWEFGDPENSGKNTPRTIYFSLNVTL